MPEHPFVFVGVVALLTIAAGADMAMGPGDPASAVSMVLACVHTAPA
jgi:hypothetical protein